MKILYLPNQYSQQRQREKPAWIYPVRMAMEATKDRNDGHLVIWDRKDDGTYDEVVTQPRYSDFLSLPIPDRRWTNAFDKRYQMYGNYKFHPATHMMVADGCWHGKCQFCVENGKRYQIRDFYDALREVEVCDALGFKEIFDDSGTFPDGLWQRSFCHEKIKSFPKMVMGCNLRVDSQADLHLMRAAGFRMVLVGVESANQMTLDKIGKGIRADEIELFFKCASAAGLEPHAAFMFGYPWESEEEEKRTLELCHFLLRKGYAKTAQASVYRPCHPCAVQGVDRGLQKKIYDVAYSLEFWINKARDLKRWEDFIYLLKGIRKGIVHD